MNVRQIDNGPLLAQLNEQKVSNNTTCELQGNTTPNMSQVVSVIEVAQRLYPDYFPASARPNRAFEIVSGAFSRRYRQTGMEITISNNQVYLTGKEYGFVPVNVGSLTTVAQILAAESAKRAGTVSTLANPSTPSNPSTPAPTDPIKPGDAIPPGDFTLTRPSLPALISRKSVFPITAYSSVPNVRRRPVRAVSLFSSPTI